MSGRRIPSIYTNSVYSRPSTDSSARNVPEQRAAYLRQPSNGDQRSRTESAASLYSRASNYSQQSGSQQSAALVASPQSPTRAAPPPLPAAESTSNTLLLAILGSPDPHLKSYVQTALGRAESISEIAILGSQSEEQALKQLKVDMYSIAGSMNRSLGVQMLLIQDWRPEELHRGIGELFGAVKKSNGVGAMAERWGGGGTGAGVEAGDKMKALRGVLLDMPRPRDGLAEAEGSAVELMELDTADLQEAWRQSVGFLHAFARETVPLLRLAAHHSSTQAQDPETSLQNPFFVTTMKSKASGLTSLNETTLRALLENLTRSTGNQGVTFGHAERILVPDPEPAAETGQPAVAPTNGWNYDTTNSPGGESPTKLWGMWSMQNELSSFD